MLNDNAFIYPLFNIQTLELEGLYPLNPSMVEPIVDEANSYYLKFYFKDGKNYILPKDNIIIQFFQFFKMRSTKVIPCFKRNLQSIFFQIRRK